jgi:iron(III) transport system ATP-binding protein
MNQARAMKKVSLQCRNIRLSFGPTEVLKGVSLDIIPGEFFALLGPSGSGKSTLLRLIAGFQQQQQGELLIDGKDVSGQAPWQREVGMVFQSYALWPHLTVWDNVAFGLVERRVDAAAIKARVGAALEQVDLSPYAQRRPSQLSGGQQQRVALARTLVTEPQLLLLDEPLSNLDKTLRVQMRQELLAMQRRLGLTTIFVTHDQEEAMTTADRMAVLDQGLVQQVGSPVELYDYPVNAFVAGFVGTMNLLTGKVRSRSAGLLTLDIPDVGLLQLPVDAQSPQTESMQLSVRPHALRLAPAAQARDERFIWLEGQVEAAEFLGMATRYLVRVGKQRLSVDHPHQMGLAGFPPGAAVALGIDPSQLRLFGA